MTDPESPDAFTSRLVCNAHDYDAADFYDASDNAENLHHESEIEAIEDHLDGWVFPGCDMRDIIAKHGACTVVAWARRTIPDREIESHADHLAESFAERLDDEYGDPDGVYPCLPDARLETLKAALVPVLRAALTPQCIWACEEVGRREFDAEEVEAMMRKENPDWFEEGAEDWAPLPAPPEVAK